MIYGANSLITFLTNLFPHTGISTVILPDVANKLFQDMKKPFLPSLSSRTPLSVSQSFFTVNDNSSVSQSFFSVRESNGSMSQNFLSVRDNGIAVITHALLRVMHAEYMSTLYKQMTTMRMLPCELEARCNLGYLLPVLGNDLNFPCFLPLFLQYTI